MILSMNRTRERVTIHGTTYDVMSSATAADHAASGHLNVARMMRDGRQVRRLALKRPRDDRAWFSVQFESGRFSTVADLGFRW